MNRRQTLKLLASLGTGGALGCRNADESAERELQVLAYFQPSSGGLYLARHKGYFDELGIRVQIEPLRGLGAMQALPALANGSADVAFFVLTPSFVSAVAKGASPRIVFGRDILTARCPIHWYIIGRRSVFPGGLDDLTVLRGKSVALTNRASLAEFALDTQLEAVGLSSDDVGLRTLQHNEALTALRLEKIDAMVAPFDLDIDPTEMDERFIRNRGLVEILPNFPTSFIYFGSSMLQGPTSLGSRFLAAYLRGTAAFSAGETPLEIQQFLDTTNVDRDLALSACRDSFAPEGAVDLESMELFVRWCFDKGYCPEPIDAEQLVDLRFLDEARRLAVLPV